MILSLVLGAQLMAGGFTKNPDLYDYNSNTPEQRNTLSSPRPEGQWDNWDKALLALYEAGNAADWSQTKQIQRSKGMYELPIMKGGSQEILGQQPTNAGTTALMGGQAIGVPLIADQLPSGWRKALLGAAAVAKGLTVRNNQKAGLDAVRW